MNTEQTLAEQIVAAYKVYDEKKAESDQAYDTTTKLADQASRGYFNNIQVFFANSGDVIIAINSRTIFISPETMNEIRSLFKKHMHEWDTVNHSTTVFEDCICSFEREAR